MANRSAPSFKRSTYIMRAIKAGHDIFCEEFDIVVYPPSNMRESCKFVLLKHGWTCDSCGSRVQMSEMTQHIRGEH